MPKTIIDVEVNDEQWQRFTKLYERYQEKIKLTGEALGKGEDAAHNTADSFHRMAAALMAQVQLLNERNRLEEKERRAEEKQERVGAKALKERRAAIKEMRENTAAIAKNLASAAATVIKWSTIGGAGLIGGGLFGIDKLATDVGMSRRSAMGLGVSVGEQSAFNLDMGRFVGGDFLSRIAGAQADWGKLWAFHQAGINEQNKDPAGLALDVISRAKQLWDRGDHTTLALQNYGLADLGLTMEEWRRIGRTPLKEIQDQRARYDKDRQKFEIGDDLGRRWQDFMTQLQRAGLEIENIFVRRLGPLTPTLTQLSEGLVDLIEKLAYSKTAGDALQALFNGATWLEKELGDPQFQANFRTFITDVDKIVESLARAIDWIDGIIHPRTKGKGDGEGVTPGSRQGFGSNRNIGGSDRPDFNNPGNLRMPGSKQFQKFATQREGLAAMGEQLWRYEHMKKWGFADTLEKIIPLYAPAKDGNNVEAYIRDVMKRTGFGRNQHLDLDDLATMGNLVSAMARHETPLAHVGNAAVVTGELQGAEYAKWLRENSAARMRDLIKEFGGDRDKAAAASVWGAENVKADVGAHGAKWKDFMPQDAMAEMKRISAAQAPAAAAQGQGKPPKTAPTDIKVHVFSSTGSATNVSVNNMAPQ